MIAFKHHNDNADNDTMNEVDGNNCNNYDNNINDNIRKTKESTVIKMCWWS